MPDRIDLSLMESVAIQSGPFLRIRRHWQEPTHDYWDDLWSSVDAKQYWASALKGKACGEYAPLYRKYLPERARVLEAGCGLAQVAISLRQWGHDAYGLDFAATTINLLKKQFPELPFVHGDIHSPPFADDCFDGYISLGVIEHFLDGQGRILSEANRVLRKGGTIFLSVPAVNKYRRWRSSMGLYRKSATAAFFEDSYSVEELHSLLNANGFEPMEHCYSNTVMTFAQETIIRPLYRMIEDTRYPRSAIDRILRLLLPRSWFGHMLMVVAKKK